MNPLSIKKYGLQLLSLFIFFFVLLDVFGFILTKPEVASKENAVVDSTSELTQLTVGESFNPMTDGAIGLTVTVAGISPTTYLLADGTLQPALLLTYSVENWAPVAIAIQPFTISDRTGFTTQVAVPIEGITSPDLAVIEAGQKLDFARIYPVMDYSSVQVQYDQAVWHFLENSEVPTLEQATTDEKKTTT